MRVCQNVIFNNKIVQTDRSANKLMQIKQIKQIKKSAK